MILTNQQLVNSIPVLSLLIGMELNIKVSYAIAKNVDRVERELKVYNTEKQKLIDKYGVKDKDGNIIVNENGTIDIAEDKVEQWNLDANELLAIESDVDIHLINPEDLYKCDCTITPGELMKISFLFSN
ncbi:MAG: hypothetical protein ACRCVJ_13025 [Clostridium sp.]|uniref:hypothetical protein n=1 Tax=Clostridium sp. TaxID=1506 RepID=UPI003F31D904